MIFKLFKTIKNMKKGCIFRASRRGCDVARKATWQSHTDSLKCLRGTDVTYTYLTYYIDDYSTYKHPYIGFKLTVTSVLPFKCTILFIFLRVGLCSLFYFYFRLRGVTWSVGSTSR